MFIFNNSIYIQIIPHHGPCIYWGKKKKKKKRRTFERIVIIIIIIIHTPTDLHVRKPCFPETSIGVLLG